MTWLLTILVAAIGARIAFRVARGKPSAAGTTNDESLEFQYAIGYRVLMIITLIFWLAVAAFVALWPHIAPKDRLLSLLVVVLPLTIGTGWWVLESLTRRISVTAGSVSTRSLVGAEVTLKWDEVLDLRYSALNSWLILVGPDRRRVRASRYLDGAVAFAELLKVKLPARGHPLNVGVLDIYIRLAKRAA